jgi:hypothetical protein
MSKFQEMMDNVNKLHEIKGSTTSIVATARDLYRQEVQKVEMDRDLSSEGKARKRAALQNRYGEAFIKSARQLREEYDKAAVKARVTAEMLMNEAPQKPSTTTLASFEREFNALKTDLMLESRPDTALQKLKAFADAQTDAYLANQVLQDFPSIVGSVLDAAGTDRAKYKLALKHTLDDIRNKSMSDEQKQAQEIYEQMGNEFGRDLFLQNGIEYNAIKEAFGSQFAQYSNRPQHYVLEEEKKQTEGAGE